MTALQAPGSDVAKPGTTPADPTSRPIIIGHEPASDPMVSTTQAVMPEKKPEEAPVVITSTGSMKSKITPSSTTAEVTKEAAADSDEKVAEESQQKKEDTAAEQAAHLAEIIESGEYNVSVHQKNRGSVGQFILVVIGVVLIAAVVLFILIDLNVIDVGIKIPFELFK